MWDIECLYLCGTVSKYFWAVNGHQLKIGIFKLFNINNLYVNGAD